MLTAILLLTIAFLQCCSCLLIPSIDQLRCRPVRRGFALHQYVPSGLTLEEYKEIQRKEKEELESKDFGSFGPRFAKVGRPFDDWLLQPSLWTRGILATTGSQDENIRLRWTLTVGLTRRNLAEWLVVCFSSMNVVSPLLCCRLVLTRSLLSRSAAVSATALFLAGTVVFRRYTVHALEKVNRRWLWSPRRTTVTASLATLVWQACWWGFAIATKRV